MQSHTRTGSMGFNRDYNDEQMATVKSRFSVLAGWGRRLQSSTIRQQADAITLERMGIVSQQLVAGFQGAAA